MPRAPIFVTSLIAGAFFMENLDGTIIATALPQMARSFHIGAVHLNIGMTAYLLTLAVFIPISGWVADRFGSRTIFASAVTLFTLASLLCGLCHTLTEFTLARILQGIGGAMMVPVGRLIVLRSTPKDQLTQAIAYITWPGLTALVLGPPLGGFITTYFSWHWIFFLNLPLGIAAFILTLLWVENLRLEDKHPFDWLTFGLAGFASCGAVYAMEKIGGEETQGHSAAIILALSILSGLLAFLIARRRRTASFIDLDSLRLKTYALNFYGGFCFRVAVSVLPFLLPLMFQLAFGLSAFASGLYLLALFAGDLSMKSIIIPVLRRFGFRRILILNGLFTAVSVALCGVLSTATPIALLLLILFCHGACRSMEFTCISTLAFAEITPARMSRANSFFSTIVQLSSGLGVAVGAVTLRLFAHARGHSAAQPQLRDFHYAIFAMAVLSLGPVFNALLLPRDAGAETSGHITRPDFDPTTA
jgi:EmrB/QacA subfamily drug resistance transporter